MAPLSFRQFCRQALPLFQQAGRFIADRFQKEDVLQERKSDGSLVSSVDRRVHEFLDQHLKDRFQLPVLSEEGTTPTIEDNEAFWIIDPLDGTSTFLRGQHRFFILGAYARDGRIQHSLVIHPLSSNLHLASRGRGAWHVLGAGRKRPWQKPAMDPEAPGCMMRGWENDGCQKLRQAVAEHMGLDMVSPSSTETSLMSLAGRKRCLQIAAAPLWDLATPWLLIEERGGQMTDMHGRPLSLADHLTGDFIPFIATRGFQHEWLVEMVADLPSPSPPGT